MASNRATLKTFFETGDIPTESEFAEQIDSEANLADTNLFEADNTHDANIILKNGRVAKAFSGGGQLNLRDGGNNQVSLTPDNSAFLVGFFFGDVNVGGIGFNFSGNNVASAVQCRANQVIMQTEKTTGIAGLQDMFRIIEDKIGFFTKAPVPQPTITGSRAGNAALASFLTELDTMGMIIDGTSA